MKNDIFISVIIPTYKRNDYICRAIDSVFRQKGEFEIIVVDDNDYESSYCKKNEKILSKYKNKKNFKYIQHKKNKNGAAARNTGIKIAKGKYITFLDDDDEFCDGRIEKIKEVLTKHDYDFLYTGVILRKDGINQKAVRPVQETNINMLIYKLLCVESFFGTGSNLICKKEIINKINGFDESFVRNQDIEFAIRYLNECNDIGYIDEELVIKNMDSNSNIPSLKKMKDVKQKFLTKFDDIIKKYSKEEQMKVIASNLYELYSNSVITGSRIEQSEVINLLKKSNVYSRKKTSVIYIKNMLKKQKIVSIIRNLIFKCKKI